MSVRSGRKTSREKVADYNGFSIIKVTVIEYERSIFDASRYSDFPKRKDVYYNFCKEGSEKRPSQDYQVCARSVNNCKQYIDEFIKDDTTCFTAEEREKYVYKPNRVCEWAYGYDSLMKIMCEHKKANKRMQILLEDRLEDANFHSECGLLAKGDYDGFVKLVRETYKFREKFEVVTETECCRIKNPKQFEDGLAKAINDYLASQGVKGTSVNVNLIENW